MKKVLAIILVVLVIIILTITTNIKAADETSKNIVLNLRGQTEVYENTKTVELILSLGKFTGVSENIVLGYQTTLEYDKNMFESVTVEGLNTWNTTYESSSNILIGELATATARQNTDIAKITLTLKGGLNVGTVGSVSLKNFDLTDGQNDFLYNKEIVIRVGESQNNENNNINDDNNNNSNNNSNDNSIDKENQNGNINDNDNNINNSENDGNNSDENLNKVTGNNSQNKANGSTNSFNNKTLNKSNVGNVDKTISTKSIPKAGIGNILLMAICITIVVAIIFKFKSRDIKY